MKEKRLKKSETLIWVIVPAAGETFVDPRRGKRTVGELEVVLPNSTSSGPGLVNPRKRHEDGAFQVPDDSFVRGRVLKFNLRAATDEEIAAAIAAGKEGAEPPPVDPSVAPKPTAPPRAASPSPIQAPTFVPSSTPDPVD